MSIFNSMNVSATGLTAERLRMDTIAKNIANANTTRTANGSPYRRQVVVFKTRENNNPFSKVLTNATRKQTNMAGVEVVGIKNDNSPLKKVYDPGHPDSDQEGYVMMPNVDVVTEMANMISASRGYEANVTALNAAKSMALKALEIR